MTDLLFQKNCDIFAKYSPQAAVRLAQINKNPIKVSKNKNGEENLQIKEKGKTFFLHDQKNALHEAEKWFSTLNLKNKKVLFVYGVGLGYAYNAATTWLKKNKNHTLVFLEDNLSVIGRLLETERGETLLNDKQVQLYHFQNVEDDKDTFEKIAWLFLQTPFEISALPFYAENKKNAFNELSNTLLYNASLYNDFVDEMLHFGIAYYRNFYTNILELPRSQLATQLFGKFKDVPAILCGAGPSLAKQMPLLKELSNKALIFSAGSSFNALTNHGITPHFSAGVDPNDEQSVRLKETQKFEVPFFYRNRMNHKALKMVRGPRLYLHGAGGYDTAEWFEKELNIAAEPLQEGHNVINFCIEIAKTMGCHPIILVGMDLAFTNMQAYSEGVVSNAKVNKKILHNSETVLKKDIYNKDIYTQWKWIAESGWIAKFAKMHPEISVINATEGGIGFDDIKNIPLKVVVQQQLGKKYNLKSKIEKIIASTPKHQFTKAKIRTLMHQLSASLTQCKQLLSQLIEESERLIGLGAAAPIPLESGIMALAEADLEEEAGYQAVLNSFNVVYMHVQTHEIQKMHQLPRQSHDFEVKKLHINIQRYRFLIQVADANIILIDKALQGKMP